MPPVMAVIADTVCSMNEGKENLVFLNQCSRYLTLILFFCQQL